MAFQLNVNLSKYRGKCPLCMHSIITDKYHINEPYIQYICFAKKHFKDLSFPICRFCWTYKSLKCEVCQIPTYVVSKSEFNNIVMKKTTTVDSNNHTYRCVHCT